MHKCEHCDYEQEFDGNNMYHDCPSCGVRVGMKFQHPYANTHIQKYGSGNNPMSTVWAQNKHRPRSGDL